MNIRRYLRRKRVLIPMLLGVIWLLGWYAVPFMVSLPEGLKMEPPASPVIHDRHGEPIRRLTLDDYTRSEQVSLQDLPPDLIACTLAAEDKRFWSHGGVDLLATGRAMRDFVLKRRVVSGASTITQQLVKISSPAGKRTIGVKVREALLARRVEMTWSKQEILTAYFNRLDYGNRRRGPSAAARHLFQKPLKDLSLGECALLSGLPQAPTRHNPMKRPASALARRSVVLDRLAQLHKGDAGRIQLAKGEALSLRPLKEKEHARWLSATPVHGALHTTLDLSLQRDVESIVSEEIAALKGANIRHAAVVVIHNPTGEVLALVSSGNWEDSRGGQINGAFAPRSPGSTLKPFTYLLAFQEGGRFPGSIVADVPTRFRTQEGLNLPQNFDRRHRGPVSIRTALACSLNVPAVRELSDLGGPAPLHRLLTQLGVSTLGDVPNYYGLGLTIGNAPVRLIELTNAYATLARLGVHQPLTLFQTNEPQQCSTVFDSGCAWLIGDVLSDPEARAPSFGRHGPLELPFRCAVKTGTSSDFRDNWCIGYTRDFTVGVWAGNFDHTPMKGLSGVSGAGPIFRRVMVRSQRDSAPGWMVKPETIINLRIDSRTGKSLGESVITPFARSEYCLSDRTPVPAVTSDYNQESRALLDASYEEWFQGSDNVRHKELALAADRPAPEPLKILAPADGMTCLLDPELPSGGRKFRLATNLPGVAVWSSETLEFENGPNAVEPFVLLEPGTHRLTATDKRDGSARSVSIEVEEL
jgi:penicillin-binding protein 1C